MPVLLQMSFFLVQDLGSHVAFSCPVSFVPSDLGHFLSLCLSFVTWRLWKTPAQGFVECVAPVFNVCGAVGSSGLCSLALRRFRFLTFLQTARAFASAQNSVRWDERSHSATKVAGSSRV